jgi:hypothetical protein
MKLIRVEHGVSHGFANTIAIMYRQQAGETPSSGEAMLAAQLAGPKAAMKPLFEAVIKAAKALGKDVEIAPKKANVSLRRNKQFGLVQVSTKDRVDLGLILKGVPAKGRLEDGRSWNGMCTHRVRLASKAELDKDVLNWLRKAYDQA